MPEPFSAMLAASVLGAAVSDLWRRILYVREKMKCFEPCLDQLKNTLETVRPKIEVMERYKKETPQIKELINKLKDGESIVMRCLTVKSSDLRAIKKQTESVCKLYEYLNGFFLRNLWCDNEDMKKDMSDVKKDIANINSKVDQLLERGISSSSNNGSGARDAGREVHDLEAVAPIKPITVRTSFDPPNAKANENLVHHSERAEISSAVFAVLASDLLEIAVRQKQKMVCFRPCLERLITKLETMRPIIEVMVRNYQFDKERPEAKELIYKLKEGYIIVKRCSTVKSSDYLERKRQSDSICELDDYLNRFFQRNTWSNTEDMLGILINMETNIAGQKNNMEKNFENIIAILNDQKFHQLDIGSSSSSNNGAGVRDAGREVHDLKAAVPNNPATTWTSSSDPPNVSSVKANEKLVRHSERAALEVLPFRDDDSVPFFSTSKGGFGQTSLSEGLDLANLRTSRCIKIEDANSSTKTLYQDTQLVATRYVCEIPVDSGFHFRNVTRCNRLHMLLVERVRHENVVPVRAYYYSCRPPVEQPGRLALQILLVYDYSYHSMGSVSDMLHGETKVPLDWNARVRIAIGVAKGIAFIHKQDNGSFFHGDIESSCIFLNAENYGCISDLGKCIAGNPNPYVNSSPEFLRESDVYNYGVLLLELVTGNTPRYSTLVSEFEDFIGSSKQLDSKVGLFVLGKTYGFQVLDRELIEQYGEFKEQMIQMLHTALDCVSERAPKIDDVVKRVEGILLSKPKTITLAGRHKDIITTNPRESTAIGKSLAALKVVPSFTDDFSVALVGYGRTSLPEELDLNVLLQGHPKIIGDISSSRAYLYEDNQLVLTQCPGEVPVDFDGHCTNVKRFSREHMLLIERIRHENVAPLRAYYYSSCPTTSDHKPRQIALKITLVHDYYAKGSVSDMLHGKTKVPFDWDARLRVAIGVAKGIAFIQKQDDGSFFHGDVRSSNIFLNARKYGCISALGKCIARYPNPYDTTRDILRVSDVYSYGVLLLELITGNTPRYSIFRKSILVSEIWNYIGTSEQLHFKVSQFVRGKQLNPQAGGFQLLDRELLEQMNCKEISEQLVQMLGIALSCVSPRVPNPNIFDVVERLKRVEGIGRLFD